MIGPVVSVAVFVVSVVIDVVVVASGVGMTVFVFVDIVNRGSPFSIADSLVTSVRWQFIYLKRYYHVV